MVKFVNLIRVNVKIALETSQSPVFSLCRVSRWKHYHSSHALSTGKGGKNRRRGKNENETEKRELVFKEDGQGEK